MSEFVNRCRTLNKGIPAHRLVVIAAPSGGGKTTVAHGLVERNPDFAISISATTRPARHNEVEGEHYVFLSKDAFFARVQADEFLEYEEVHGNYYGTLKSTVQQLIGEGKTVIFDIDVNGALRLKAKYPDMLLIFLQPPSVDALRKRLRGRQTDDLRQIEKRLQRLPQELEKAQYFDVNVQNAQLDLTIAQIEKIIRDHQKRYRHV